MRLERTCRLVLRLFPAAWRREHGAELVATLLEAERAGRPSLGIADVADLVRCALTLRLRAARRALGPARLASLGIAIVLAVALAAEFRSGEVPAAFLVTSLVVAAIPGTGVLFTVASAIGGGGRRGLIAAAGCTLGVLPHLFAAMLGLSGVMQVGASVFEIVRYAGVAYLIVMGVSMVRERGDLLDGARPEDTVGGAAIVRRGIVLNLLNPKLTLFFFAFLPQFLGPSPDLLDTELVVLGAVFMLVTFVVFAGYACASAALRERVLAAPAARRLLQRTLGGLLIAFGVRLAVSD